MKRLPRGVGLYIYKFPSDDPNYYQSITLSLKSVADFELIHRYEINGDEISLRIILWVLSLYPAIGKYPLVIFPFGIRRSLTSLISDPAITCTFPIVDIISNELDYVLEHIRLTVIGFNISTLTGVTIVKDIIIPSEITSVLARCKYLYSLILTPDPEGGTIVTAPLNIEYKTTTEYDYDHQIEIRIYYFNDSPVNFVVESEDRVCIITEPPGYNADSF